MKEIAISKFKARCLGILEEVRKTRRPIRVTRIAAAARVFDLTLVTADEKLIANPNIKILANR